MKPIYIDTFITKGYDNYQLAQSHYQTILNSFNNELEKKIEQTNNTISELANSDYNIQKFLDDRMSAFQFSWQSIYDAANKNKAETQKLLSEMKELIQKHNDSTGDMIDMKAFLEKLKNGLNIKDNNGADINLNMFSGLSFDLSALDGKVYKSILNGNVTNIIAIFGEFFEQAVNQIIASEVGSIIEEIHTGSIKSATNYQRAAKVKPDTLIAISGMDIKIEDADLNKVRSFSSQNTGASSNFELQDLINLSNYQDEEELVSKVTRPFMMSSIIGGTYKMYSGDMIHNFGKIASIQKAADLSGEYKSYFPNEEGAKPETQRAYNYWAHSRYLIAIIGAYNALYVTGGKFGSTADLLNTLMIQQKGIMGKRDSLLRSAGAQAVIKNIYI